MEARTKLRIAALSGAMGVAIGTRIYHASNAISGEHLRTLASWT